MALLPAPRKYPDELRDGTTFATRADAEHALIRYITAGTTRAASKPASAACLPTSTKTPTIAPSATPTDNPDSGKTGVPHAAAELPAGPGRGEDTTVVAATAAGCV
jgi:hypothetical protein